MGSFRRLTYDEFVSQFIKWDKSTLPVTTPGLVQYPRFTNSYTVRNTGTVNLLIDGDLLVPGTYKSFGGEPRSVYSGDIEIRWQLQAPPPTSIIYEATLTFIFYVNDSIG